MLSNKTCSSLGTHADCHYRPDYWLDSSCCSDESKPRIKLLRVCNILFVLPQRSSNLTAWEEIFFGIVLEYWIRMLIPLWPSMTIYFSVLIHEPTNYFGAFPNDLQISSGFCTMRKWGLTCQSRFEWDNWTGDWVRGLDSGGKQVHLFT